jgi:eukaryotic-like serine/threonine-protein kinase
MVDDSANSNGLPRDPLIGVVFGRYEIKELIETSGWGNVYRATDSMLEKDVAIKIVHDHVLKDASNIKRFRREARLLCRLESRYVIRVLDADTTPAPYLVVEYFDGIPLDKWLSANGPMNAQMAIDLFCQLCGALAEAQALDIVHRDLKPASILIKTNDNAVEARIVDFGLAKCLTSDNTCGSQITSPGEMLGSPPYMSPEHFDGNWDYRSDIYSLGCIMYELLAGRPAFKAKFAPEYLRLHRSTLPERISKVNPGSILPAGLEEVIFTCLEKSPNRRYQTAKLCAEDLKAIKS